MKNIKPYTNYLEESFSGPFNGHTNEDLTSGMSPAPKDLDVKLQKMIEEVKKPSPEDLLMILKEFDRMNADLQTLVHVYNTLKKENPEFNLAGVLAKGGSPSEAAREAAQILSNRHRKSKGGMG